jgi:hypothetical protein
MVLWWTLDMSSEDQELLLSARIEHCFGHSCIFLFDPVITKFDEPKETLCWLKE